jgi:hypothetical protein
MASFHAYVHSHWSHLFDDFNYSTQAFYDEIENLIEKRKIPKITIRHVELSVNAYSMDRRDYLRIKMDEYIFDICAAPYGTGFFVSWWYGEKDPIASFLLKIPIIGRFLVPRKTYFQLDSETMFEESIKNCFYTALETVSKTKGIQQLSKVELQPKDVRL